MLRDHAPVLIEDFNGLFRRGDPENCPLDHFTDCNNLQFIDGGFRTRDGIELLVVDDNDNTIPNVVRHYTFVHDGVQSLLVLDALGNLYHTASPTPLTPILSIPEMTDFAFIGVAGRAYISPHDGVLGLEDEFLYLYLGDGTPARKACGAAPTTAVTLALGAASPEPVETGYHVFGVVYETDTGFRTKISPLAEILATGAHKIDISNIPVSPDSFVVARWIVVSKAINPIDWNANPVPEDYELFFLPDGRIDDNSTTVLNDVGFYDSELLESADPLLDLAEEMAAGSFLSSYHNRMILGGQFGEPNPDPELDTLDLTNTAWVSLIGEPEAFDTVDGLIVTPEDGYSLTNGQEYRDILYLFKNTRTYAYTDNADVPATWPLTIIDQGLGASIHGVCTVGDSGGINAEFIILVNFAGIFLFNGAFIRPELTWKISDLWLDFDKDEFNLIQIVNDPIGKCIYLTTPDFTVILGDYTNALSHEAIKWCPWTFRNAITTVAILDTTQLVLGGREAL
jgi:hypothetical protein